ncbi:hypothetical protein TorRG33x02_075010, partial [Trema orientale]
ALLEPLSSLLKNSCSPQRGKTQNSSPGSSFSGVQKSTRVRPKRKLSDSMEKKDVMRKYLRKELKEAINETLANPILQGRQYQ